MKQLLIVYHSQGGSTARLARAACAGACGEEGLVVRLCAAAASDSADLRWCDGVIFATPENFGYLAGMMKDFLDRTYYAVRSDSRCWPYALIVSAGNDGTGAARQLQRIVTGYPMRAVAEPLIVRGVPDVAAEHAAAELGQGFAAGLVMGMY